MKKIVLLVVLAVFGLSATQAQTKAKGKKGKKAVVAKVETPKVPKVEGAGMLFENETIDYGTIPHSADGKREFVFVNNGNQPLIITSATGSCGCTVPSFPKDPIAPGEKSVIGVKYDTTRQGAFTKNVTIKSNAVQGDTKVLTIKGNVLPADPAPAPATPVAEPAHN